MSEKRFHQFGLWVIDNPNFNGISIADLVDTELMSITEVVNLLNEQQTTIEQLKAKLREKEEDEKLYANEILELREINKEWLQFKELGGDY